MNVRSLMAVLVAVALLPAGTAAQTPATSPVTPSLQVLVVSTQLWVGQNDLLLDLLDQNGERLPDAGRTASIELVGPDGKAHATIPLERIRLSNTGRLLHRARVMLDAPGDWIARASIPTGAGGRLDGAAPFVVMADAGTPGLGQPAIPVRTPTVSWGPIASITSDRDPLPALYWWSLDDALRAQRPILYVIDTARPGVGDGCGSAIGEARVLGGSFPGLVVIHAEPFVFGEDGAIVTGPDQGPVRIAPWAAAWGVSAPPWMFVIGSDGLVHAKFQGVFGTDELLSALRQVAPFAPGSH